AAVSDLAAGCVGKGEVKPRYPHAGEDGQHARRLRVSPPTPPARASQQRVNRSRDNEIVRWNRCHVSPGEATVAEIESVVSAVRPFPLVCLGREAASTPMWFARRREPRSLLSLARV